MFIDLKEALEWVDSRRRFDHKTDLHIMLEASRLLKNPEKSFEIIHIGGTNGKGSTSTLIFHILKEAGYKVGLYTSPFVTCFNERIRYMNEYISDEDCLRLINFLHDFNDEFEKTHETLTFFEIVTLMSFIYFKERGARFVVMEVGLGGRLDATNIITPLVSAITVVQKDHTQILGKTYKLILKEKLGIMKDNVPFVTGENKETLKPIFKEFAMEHHSPLYFVNNIRNIRLSDEGTSFSFEKRRWHSPLIGSAQALNCAIAIKIAHILDEKNDIKISDETIQNGIDKTSWPGRFEVIKKDKIILDGGHNPGALAETFKTLKLYSSKKIVEVFACMKDKDYISMVELIDKNVEKVIFTQINYPRALNAIELLKTSHLGKKFMINNDIEAVRYAIDNLEDDEILLINGSLYFISEVRLYLKGEKECLN